MPMRSLTILTMAAAAALLFAACSGGAASQAPASQLPASEAPASQAPASAVACAEPYTIGFVAFHLDTYFVSVQKGIENALGECGTLTVISVDDDLGKEAQAFQDLISRQVDAVFVSPLNPTSSVAGVKAVSDAGIPVFCFNSCINEADAAKYVKGQVYSDNRSLGELSANVAVDFIKSNMAGKELVLADLNCDTAAPVCLERKAGWYETLDAAGIKYTIADSQTSYIADQTLGVAENMLTAHPDINIFWSATDGGGAGELKAVQNQNKVGQTFVFSTDMTQTLGEALLAEPPVLITTTGQDGDGQGAALVEMALTMLGGGTPDSTEVFVPGINFNRDDPDAVKAWLAANA